MLVNRPLTGGRRSATKRGGMPGNWTPTDSKEVCQRSEEAPSSGALVLQIRLLTVANDPAANEHLEAHCLQAVSNIARATVNARGARRGAAQTIDFLKSGDKIRVIPAFHRSSFELGIAGDFCFVGRRLSICLICAGVLPRTS